VDFKPVSFGKKARMVIDLCSSPPVFNQYFMRSRLFFTGNEILSHLTSNIVGELFWRAFHEI
jgi:hypothetical protein